MKQAGAQLGQAQSQLAQVDKIFDLMRCLTDLKQILHIV